MPAPRCFGTTASPSSRSSSPSPRSRAATLSVEPRLSFSALSFLLFAGPITYAEAQPAGPAAAPSDAPSAVATAPAPFVAPAPFAPSYAPVYAPPYQTLPTHVLRRVYGFGSLLGIGFAGNSATLGGGYYGLGGSLPSFEAQIFLRHGFSLDFANSLGATIYFASLNDHGFYFNQDVFFSFNPGGRNVRAILGPGLGFAVAKASEDLVIPSIRFPAEVGIEVLTNNQQFGLKVLLRPWIEQGGKTCSSLNGPNQNYFDAGVMLLTGVSGYFVQ